MHASCLLQGLYAALRGDLSADQGLSTVIGYPSALLSAERRTGNRCTGPRRAPGLSTGGATPTQGAGLLEAHRGRGRPPGALGGHPVPGRHRTGPGYKRRVPPAYPLSAFRGVGRRGVGREVGGVEESGCEASTAVVGMREPGARSGKTAERAQRNSHLRMGTRGIAPCRLPALLGLARSVAMDPPGSDAAYPGVGATHDGTSPLMLAETVAGAPRRGWGSPEKGVGGLKRGSRGLTRISTVIRRCDERYFVSEQEF